MLENVLVCMVSGWSGAAWISTTPDASAYEPSGSPFNQPGGIRTRLPPGTISITIYYIFLLLTTAS